MACGPQAHQRKVTLWGVNREKTNPSRNGCPSGTDEGNEAPSCSAWRWRPRRVRRAVGARKVSAIARRRRQRQRRPQNARVHEVSCSHVEVAAQRRLKSR
eukprot:6208586-Prymnesium_polylepis.1